MFQPDPSIVEYNDKTYFTPRSQVPTEDREFLLDKDWAKNSFLVGDKYFEDDSDMKNRYWSSAQAKFVDGRLGNNIGINAKPQFTRYADVRHRGKRADVVIPSIDSSNGPFGLGRYYSEAFDDAAQNVYLTFGVPQFNSLLSFVKNAFTGDMIYLVKSGSTSLAYDAGKIIGGITASIAFPMVSLAMWGAKAFAFVFDGPVSKYYTLKPTMPLYWGAVNTLVNQIAINRGIFPRVMPDVLKPGEMSNEAGRRLGQPMTVDQAQLDAISMMMPDVFTDSNYFDIHKLANKAQRMANQVFINDYLNVDKGTNSDFEGYLKRITSFGTHKSYVMNSNGDHSFSAAINRYLMFGYYNKTPDSQGDSTAGQDPRAQTDEKDPKNTNMAKNKEGFLNYFDAEFRSGSRFAVFRVDHTGSIQESFSNSVQESELSSKVNSKASDMRSASFTFSDGNILGSAQKEAVSAVTQFALGALDGLTFGFSTLLAGLAGVGYIDIPKHWQSSTASLPRASYKMSLVSPYGNVMSQMQNIIIPLCMLLAGGLPRSTGKQSYGSPFICQLFDRGRCQVKLGMIESISINRGTTHLAFDTKGHALGVEVSFQVVDLSSILHMPISNGGLLSFDTGVDEDNILGDYMAVLAGQGHEAQIYGFPKLQLKLAKLASSKMKYASAGWWAMNSHSFLTDNVFGMFISRGTGLLLEAAVRGSSVAAGAINN